MSFFKSLKKQLNPFQNKTTESHKSAPQVTLIDKDQYHDLLKRLIPIGILSQQEFASLAISTSSYQAGEIIFKQNQSANTINYLVSGSVYIETSGDYGIAIEENTFHALYPLSSGSFRNATAIARKESTILNIPLKAMDMYFNKLPNNADYFLQLPKQYQKNKILQRIVATRNLQMPVLPDIAFKLRKAIEQDADIGKIVKIINLDAALSAKLIQVANSPFYHTVNPTTNCQAAITRIGLNSTNNIITSISLNGLFKTKHKELDALAQNYWKQSIQISALSFTLAKLLEYKDTEEALLAGLTCNIGVIPFLKFADEMQDFDLAEVKSALPFVTGALSAHVLGEWNFPDKLRQLPLEINSWFLYKPEKNIELNDIVLLAKYHSYIGGKAMHKLPPITSLPSYSAISDGALSPDNSLQILHDAKQQISEAMRFFSS